MIYYNEIGYLRFMPLDEISPVDPLVEACKENVLAHKTFKSHSDRAFFKFMIGIAQAGRGALSAEQILTELFDTNDPHRVVQRVSALRTALEEYYDQEGASDPIKFTIPPKSEDGYRLICERNPKKAMADFAVISTDLISASEDAKIVYPWDQQIIYKLLRSAEPGTEVRLLTTFFIDVTELQDLIVNELLPRGVDVKIVMLDSSKKELFQSRFERLINHPTPSQAEKLLNDQLDTFETLSTRQHSAGSIEVRRSGIMPFGFFAQCGDEIRIGLLLPMTSYHQGPMIAVKSNSSIGKLLGENWLGYWSYRSQSELMEIESSSNVGQVWLATPDLSNDTGIRARFKEVVRKNVERDVRYSVIFPRQRITEKQLREFRELFPLDQTTEKRLGITEIPVDDTEFLQLTLKQVSTSHIVIFNPNRENNQPADLYMEIPAKPLWRKLEGEEAKATLNKFMALIPQ